MIPLDYRVLCHSTIRHDVLRREVWLELGARNWHAELELDAITTQDKSSLCKAPKRRTRSSRTVIANTLSTEHTDVGVHFQYYVFPCFALKFKML
jgi:hypothetical protein